MKINRNKLIFLILVVNINISHYGLRSLKIITIESVKSFSFPFETLFNDYSPPQEDLFWTDWDDPHKSLHICDQHPLNNNLVCRFCLIHRNYIYSIKNVCFPEKSQYFRLINVHKNVWFFTVFMSKYPSWMKVFHSLWRQETQKKFTIFGIFCMNIHKNSRIFITCHAPIHTEIENFLWKSNE
jgi:hypothetical protein